MKSLLKPKKGGSSRSGKSVHGTVDPFINNRLVELHNRILSAHHIVDLNSIEEFREAAKDAVAQRMRQPVDKFVNRKSYISEESQNIINNALVNKYGQNVASFVACTILYFNGARKRIDTINTRCSSCRSDDPKIAFSHARKDCTKMAAVYVNNISKKLCSNEWKNVGQQEKDRISSITVAITVFSNYIHKLYTSQIPKEIPSELFNNACIIDNSLSLRYTISKKNGTYLRNQSTDKFDCVSQECATFLIMNV